MTTLFSRRVLLPGGVQPASVTVDGASVMEVRPDSSAGATDLGDMLLAPGLIDIHGDAFERQIMPRPGVMMDLAIGLEETDRQLASNGITTAFHGLTWSWEPGLRSIGTGRGVIEALERLRPQLAVDHKVHLRFETHNLDGLDEAIELIAQHRVDLLAFNDHTPALAAKAKTVAGTLGYAIRSGVSVEAFNELTWKMTLRADEVPDGMKKLAARAMAEGLPMLSHDDSSPLHRQQFHALGCQICEFPTNLETAEEARRLGDWVVMGSPNVVRGKSHIGWVSARDLVDRKLCSILASDYFYPAMLQCVFRLVREGALGLEEAWDLVSRSPAMAAGLEDRGFIAAGARADLVAVDDRDPTLPRIAMTMSAGQIAYRRSVSDWL